LSTGEGESVWIDIYPVVFSSFASAPLIDGSFVFKIIFEEDFDKL